MQYINSYINEFKIVFKDGHHWQLTVAVAVAVAVTVAVAKLLFFSNHRVGQWYSMAYLYQDCTSKFFQVSNISKYQAVHKRLPKDDK